MRWIVLCGLLALLAGCGWSSEPPAPADQRPAVEDAVMAYRDGVLANDPVRVCAAYSAVARSSLEASYGETCPEAGSAYIGAESAEPIHVRRWRISTVVVHGDRATVRFAPGPHVVDQRQTLVHEPDGWKLERFVESFVEQAPWEHCVSKVTADRVGDVFWDRLGNDTVYDYAERYCDVVNRLPRDATDRDFDNAINETVQSLLDDGKIGASDAAKLKVPVR